MRDLLKRNRLQINKDLSTCEVRKYFSPSCYSDSIVVFSALRANLKGKCIDIGCGDMPYRSQIEKQLMRYDSLDIERRVPGVTYVADVQDMSIIENDSYDSALCLEVLEHVPNPFKAISEIHRILKRNARLVCSVPHLSRLHEEPHDYFRYTKHGLRYLFENAGFRIISIEPTGGIFCFLGHQFSTLLIVPIWHIPILKNIGFFINKWFVLRIFYIADKFFDRDKLFALGYSCVVEKL